MAKTKRFAHRPERDRAIFEVLRAVRGVKAAHVARKCFVSASTIAKWRKPVSAGGTRYPQHATLSAVARTAGLVYKLVPLREAARQEKPIHLKKPIGDDQDDARWAGL